MIKPLEFPTEILPSLKIVASTPPAREVSAQELLEFGIPMPRFSKRIEADRRLFEWVCASQDILLSLALIVDDCEFYSRAPMLMRGEKRIRIELLVRAYFQEVYRLRDVFRHYSKALVRLSFHDRHAHKSACRAFDSSIGEYIEIRNLITHTDAPFMGADHSWISIVEQMKAQGYGFKRIDTEEIDDLDKLVAAECSKRAKVLLPLTASLRDHIQSLAYSLAGVIERQWPDEKAL